MLFNSFSFALFFPIVTILYFLLPQRLRWAHLLAASCLFYMAFVPIYIAILGFTIVVDYLAGILIAQAQGLRRRLYLAASIVANVGVLAVFKYYDFLTDNVSWLTGARLHHLSILLPIGLSFHTFQAMSYTIEVYRGNQQPERHFGIYALYVMFYPQLVAGPIERPQNLLGQFREEHRFDYDRVVAGLQRMALGLFKKVVIADRLATEVDRIYNAPTQFHGVALILATLFFAVQIYLDFSGYSDIAIGAAQVMGFKLMENFRAPYLSRSVSEFWRRWHISLSTWFRDYLYFPLGGSRGSRLLRWRNLSIVFVLSGLWHGANWTFVVWGALHATFMIAEDGLPWLKGHLTTLIAVCFAWIFFRAHTISDAGYIVTHLFTGLSHPLDGVLVGRTVSRMILIGAFFAVELWQEQGGSILTSLNRAPALMRWATYFGMVYACVFFYLHSQQQSFIYFQF